MQLTRFDRWLRKTFLYEMHIRTLRPAPVVPPRVRVVDLTETALQRYRHLYITRNNEHADTLIAALRENGQMFTTEVVERKKWYLPIITPAHKSFTWSLVSLAITLSSVTTIAYWVLLILRKPVVKGAIDHAFELMR